MLRFWTLPNCGRRLISLGMLAVFSVAALLGSGGLHAIAPTCCHSHAEPVVAHTHHGCTHSHSHAPAPAKGQETPAPCDHEDCLVCKFVATPVVLAAMVVARVASEPLDERVVEVAAHARPRDVLIEAIRGPPGGLGTVVL